MTFTRDEGLIIARLVSAVRIAFKLHDYEQAQVAFDVLIDDLFNEDRHDTKAM